MNTNEDHLGSSPLTAESLAEAETHIAHGWNPYPQIDEAAFEAAVKVVKAEPSAALEGDLRTAIAAYLFNAKDQTHLRRALDAAYVAIGAAEHLPPQDSPL